jgi:hypothetical protein
MDRVVARAARVGMGNTTEEGLEKEGPRTEDLRRSATVVGNLKGVGDGLKNRKRKRGKKMNKENAHRRKRKKMLYGSFTKVPLI